MRVMLNPKVNGALGNGVNDDTAAIQDSLDECANLLNSGTGFGDVCFPPGTYLVSGTLNVSSYCSILLNGATLKCAAGMDAPLLKLECKSNVKIHGGGGFLAGSDEALMPNQHALQLDGVYGVEVLDLMIKDMSGDGLILQGNSDDSCPRSKHVRVFNVQVDNCRGNGVVVRSSTYSTLDSVQSENCDAHGFLLQPNKAVAEMCKLSLLDCSSKFNALDALLLDWSDLNAPADEYIGISIDDMLAEMNAGQNGYRFKGFPVDVEGRVMLRDCRAYGGDNKLVVEDNASKKLHLDLRCDL